MTSMPTPDYLRGKTMSEQLAYLADKLVDVGVRLDEPFELVAELGAVSFCLHLLAERLARLEAPPSGPPDDQARWENLPRG